MLAKVISPFKLKGQVVTAGTILKIQAEVAERLIGKVEVLETEGAVRTYPSDQPDVDVSHLIKWKTKTGRDIYLITSERIRRTAPEDKAVFTLVELDRMRGLPDDQVDTIITTKEVFPGAVVEG